MQIKYKVKGLKELEKYFKKSAKTLTNYRKPLNQCGLWMLKSVAAIFKQEGDPKWKKLSDATIDIDPDRAGGKILQDTGVLRASVGRKNKPGGIYNLKDTFLEFGSSLGYAWVHQEGYPQNRLLGKVNKPIPARPFLKVLPRDEDAFVRIFAKWLDKSGVT